MKYPEFVEFRKSTNNAPATTNENDIAMLDKTPEEAFEESYLRLRNELAASLLLKIKESSPVFFERLVVELLVAMGYGGSRVDAGKAVGQTADGGIDGIINEDRLGLDSIYIQAKRWDTTTIGRPEIQKFIGALAGQKAKKGIFITTSGFSSDAKSFVSNLSSDTKIRLIDGVELTKYMIDFNVGVTTVSSYEIKKIDSDYFIEE